MTKRTDRRPGTRRNLLVAAVLGLSLRDPGRAQGTPAVLPAVGAGSEPGPGLSLLEAIRETLRNHPDIRAAEADVQARGADVQAAAAVFDPVWTARVGHAHSETAVLPGESVAGESDLVVDSTELGLGAATTLSWGTSIVPSVRVTRDHVRRLSGDPAGGAMSVGPSRKATVALTIAQPLLRGRGEAGTASRMIAGRYDRETAEHLRTFTAQQLVFGTITAYWTLLAATEQVSILEAALARAQLLLNETRILVQNSHRPAADLVQIEAHLHDRARALAEGRKAERTALHALGLALADPDIGHIRTPRLTNRLPPPRGLRAMDFEVRAWTARPDALAVRSALMAAYAALAGAERNSLPALDLSLSVGYSGAIDDGGAARSFAAFTSNVPGVNLGASLALELPLRNDARRAERDRRRAELTRTLAQVQALKNRILARVRSAVDELRASAEALTEATQAAQRYGRAIEDEGQLLRAGLTTIIEVVFTQEGLTDAELNLTRARLQFAVDLARLRFEAGDLPALEGDASEMVRLVLDDSVAAHG